MSTHYSNMLFRWQASLLCSACVQPFAPVQERVLQEVQDEERLDLACCSWKRE